mgnify:CR=1 FL=1
MVVGRQIVNKESYDVAKDPGTLVCVMVATKREKKVICCCCCCCRVVIRLSRIGGKDLNEKKMRGMVKSVSLKRSNGYLPQNVVP